MFVSHGFSTSVQHPLATWPYATYAAQGACGGFGHERPWKLRLKVIFSKPSLVQEFHRRGVVFP